MNYLNSYLYFLENEHECIHLVKTYSHDVAALQSSFSIFIFYSIERKNGRENEFSREIMTNV